MLYMNLGIHESTASYFYRTITIDHTKVGSSTHTDFPMLFAGTYSYLATEANGGKVKSASGYDIQFFSDSGLTTPLKFERVFWSASTGECQFYIKIPSLSNSSDTVIYMKYGDSSITTDQQDVANTWKTAFKGVWHMEGDSSDSSQANHDGTDTSVTYNTTNGKHQKGAGFVYTNSSKINIGTSADYDSGALTIFTWINSQSFPNAHNGVIDKDNSTTPYWAVLTQSNGKLSFFIYTTYDIYTLGSATMSTDTWYRICCKYDSTNGLFTYINGTQDTSAAAGGNQAAVTGRDLVIGASSLAGRYSSSKLDEVMFLNQGVSADWVTADYNNQNSPSTFYTVSNEL